MRLLNAYYLIIDLEATCSNDGTVPRDEMEIIEIGAVMQSSRTFEIESEFQTFVRPVRHSELTEFCTELTGIVQKDVEEAQHFPEALQALEQWKTPFDDAFFCSWGAYDKSQFIQDCEFHQIDYPFTTGHLNLKAEFANTIGRKKGAGITDALRFLGLEFVGSHHRGLDDARNIARIVRQVCVGG